MAGRTKIQGREGGLTYAIQESLVSILCYDNSDKGAKFFRTYVPLTAYDYYFKDIAAEADKYIEKFGCAPGEHTLDLINKLSLQFPDRQEQYETIFQSLQNVKGTENKPFLVEQAGIFVRLQRSRATFQKVFALLKNPKAGETELNEVDVLLANYLKPNAITDLGNDILLNDPQQALSFLTLEEASRLPIGIPEFDALGICPARKEYLLVMANSGTGKTFCAVHIGVAGLRAGHRVCHITLEMSKEKVARRYVQMLTSTSKREKRILSRLITKDEKGRMLQFDDKTITRPTLQDEDILSFLTKKLKPLANRPPLYIKDFPSGSLTVRKLKAYIAYKESVDGVCFDEFLIDYPDLMELTGKNKREDLERIAVDLRGIAAERNAAVVGFSQVNETKQGRVIKLGRAHESRAKEHTADIIVTLNQTETEKEMSLLRAHAAKVRDEVSGVTVLISQALDCGQFRIDSALRKRKEYWKLIDENENEPQEAE